MPLMRRRHIGGTAVVHGQVEGARVCGFCLFVVRKGGAAWCVMHQGATRAKSRLHLGFFAGMMAACRFAVGGVAFLCSHFLLSV